MVESNLKQRIIAALDELDESQAEDVLHYVEGLKAHDEQPPADDPIIGFITGDGTLSARDSKQILRDAITRRSGWTQKESD
jgi:hypothetical protein